ncbi:MAG TPA: efflux RND transporter periplasmic adaptor subunit [Solimonas sp.]|nr:efflux RND transporter periplasmic adaptor subunit [Solimonas sp.]
MRPVLILLPALLLAACSANEPPPAAAPPPRSVQVALPQDGPATPPVESNGVVAYRDETRLSFMVPGIVQNIAVREGDIVQRGQQLATLEPAQVDAGSTQAREAWLKTKRDLERGQKLFHEDVLTREQLDDLNTAERMARAGLSNADFARNNARIVAPTQGRILRRLSESREMVAAGQPVLTLGDTGSGMVLRLGLADREVVRLQDGDAATLRFDAFPGKEFAGKVQELSRAADPRMGTYRVDIAFDPGQTPFVSGLIGRAEIRGGAGGESLQYIPLTALVEGDQRNMLVYLLPQGGTQVKAQRVPIAFVAGDRAALAQPLPAGHAVVTEGATYLRDGEKVSVIAETTAKN